MQPVAFLRLQQMFDSQFPVGVFAHSGGIETYAQIEGFGPEALEELLLTQLNAGWGRLDLAAAALSFRAETVQRLDELAAEVEAWKPVAGQRLAGERVGRRMQILVKRLFPAEMAELDVKPPQAPVVAGAAARRLGFEEKAFLLYYAHATMTASLAASTRSMALSPERAHEILAASQPAVAEQVETVLAEPAASFYAATPGLDLRGHQQAFLHTRLFQS